MASKTSKIILCVILVIVISCAVYAQNISKPINAVYRDIKLVVDGIEVTPKDVKGDIVEPFIYNGTTYLPVRAVGQAFNKNVEWDGETSTVYIGEVTKPAKKVYLYSRPYIGCDDKNDFDSGKSGNVDSVGFCTNYVGFRLSHGVKNDVDDRYYFSNFVTYPTNALAKKVTGTLMPAYQYKETEYRINIYNESGKLLYQSPIMTKSTDMIDFEVDVANAINLKFEFEANSSDGWWSGYCIIKDLAIYTTDY
ncbi:MAG: copper amine oxidase N-terminal domain-containing protein [Ruminococcaceae bacterium]|nr:copper amine oxidase N-terminal domain-containing protein [Oscillospiraceae bacterium]